MMYSYWRKIDNLHHHNRLLLAMIALLFVLVISLLIILATMPSRYEFWLSPKMSSNGGLMQVNDVSNEYVQGFVATLLPTLYSWSQSGKKEFQKNIQSFHYYFTPRHQQLLRESLRAYKDAQLFNRSQVASLYRFMEPSDVKRIADNAWEVSLVMRVTQRLKDDNAMVIADKVVSYHIRVVKLNYSKLQNPFQLALDGYTQPEERLQDLLAHEERDSEAY